MHYVEKKGWKMVVDIAKGELLHCVKKEILFWPWSLATMCTSTKIEGG